MYTLSTQSDMSRKKQAGPFITFQLRLSGLEAERFLVVKTQARGRNPRITDTDINRRLLGLDSDIDGAVTEADRRFFVTGKASKSEVQLIGRPQSAKPDLRQVSPGKTKLKQAR